MVKVKVRTKEGQKNFAILKTDLLNHLGFNAGTAIQALGDQYPGVILDDPMEKTSLQKEKCHMA